jgi:hypothetical protein
MIHMRIRSTALAAALISICAVASTSAAAPINPCGLRSSARAIQCPPPAQVCPLAIPYTDPASGVAAEAATLEGHILSPLGDARWHFEYGLLPGLYTGRTPDTDAPAGISQVSALIGGLAPGTTYHFRLVLTSCGVTQFGDDLALRTSGAGEASSADQPVADGTVDAAGAGAALAAVAVTPQATAAATARAVTPKKATKARRHRRARRHH